MVSQYTWVTGKPVMALREPEFIIKVGQKYYVTKAVWEYDLADADGDPDKEEGCNQIANEFDEIEDSHIAKIRDGGAGGDDANQTNPG